MLIHLVAKLAQLKLNFALNQVKLRTATFDFFYPVILEIKSLCR